MRHVTCEQGWHSTIYTGDQCRICWKDKNPATRHAAPRTSQQIKLDKLATHQPTERLQLPVLYSEKPCVYLGESLPQQGCGCREKLRRCDIHDTCTTGSQRPGVACCAGCGDYRSIDDGDEDRRHLLYFVYPVSGNGLWQRRVDRMKQYLPLFNGRRVVAIAHSSHRDRLDPPEEVVKRFGKDEADFLFIRHERKLGEVIAFPHLWERVRPYQTDRDYTFYGHTKGVTKPNNPGISVHRWGDLMERANLENWDVVKESLRTHPITGAFKKSGRCFSGRGLWHYHGTFYWCRNRDVFSTPRWRQVGQFYGGTELWPATMWDDSSSGCHFYGGVGFSMYSIEEVTRAERAIDSSPAWSDRNMGDPAMLEKLRHAAATLPDPPSNLSGSGVVTFTSTKYFPGTYVLIRMLRHFGYRGLIQVWERPSEPVPDILREQPGVEIRQIIDTCEKHRLYHRTWALMNCGLKNVFLLGSDAYPVADITPCFDDLHHAGNVLWQDHTTGDPIHPALYGLPESIKQTTFTPQGDTMLLDVSRMWKPLALTHWINCHDNYYFPWQIGDQTSWRVALEMTKTPIYRYSPDRVDASLQVVFVHQGRDGTSPLIVHRTGAKMAPDGVFPPNKSLPPVEIDNLPFETTAWNYYDEYHSCVR